MGKPENAPHKRNRKGGKYVLLLILMACLSFRGLAQEDELGAWYIYNGFFNFSPKFELFFETQLRTYEVFGNPETFFLRPFFNYNVNKNFQTGISAEYHISWTYATNPENKIQSDEFRSTLQAMVFQNIGRVSLQHRYRYEFRNVDGEDKQRIRYRFQVTIPISNTIIEPRVFFVNTNAELMIDTDPKLGVNQTRVYFAGGYQFNKSLNFQFGYLIVNKPSMVLHRLQFFLTQKLWFFER